MSELYHNVELIDRNDLLPPGPFQDHTCIFGGHTEFTDKQINRLDEIQDAAYEFLKVLAETDDIPRDLDAIWDVIYSGCNKLVTNYGRRVNLPTHVTEKDGKEYITDWYEKEDALENSH